MRRLHLQEGGRQGAKARGGDEAPLSGEGLKGVQVGALACAKKKDKAAFLVTINVAVRAVEHSC